MKRLLAVALFASTTAAGSPFIQADVVAGVASCGVYLDTQPKVIVSASGLTCRYDWPVSAVGTIASL